MMFLSGLESSETPEPAGKVLEPFFFRATDNQTCMPTRLRARTHVADVGK